MALTNPQRQKVTNAFMQAASSVYQELPFDKVDIFNAVGDTDDYQASIQANYNAALPQPFKNDASASQKALVFMAVAMGNYLIGDADAVEMLSQIVAEMRDIGGA